MDKTELNDEVQIDLSELFKLIKKHLKLIIQLLWLKRNILHKEQFF